MVRTWSPSMRRVARWYGAPEAVADEVVQDTWVAVLRGLDRFEGRSTLRTWALRICANIARRRATHEARTLPFSSWVVAGDDEGPVVDPDRFRGPDDRWPGHWAEDGTPDDWGPAAVALTAELRTVLRAALRALPPRQAAAVALLDGDGLGTSELAELLGTSDGNVRVLLHRGRSRLRTVLEDYHRGRLQGAS